MGAAVRWGAGVGVGVGVGWAALGVWSSATAAAACIVGLLRAACWVSCMCCRVDISIGLGLLCMLRAGGCGTGSRRQRLTSDDYSRDVAFVWNHACTPPHGHPVKARARSGTKMRSSLGI